MLRSPAHWQLQDAATLPAAAHSPTAAARSRKGIKPSSRRARPEGQVLHGPALSEPIPDRVLMILCVQAHHGLARAGPCLELTELTAISPLDGCAVKLCTLWYHSALSRLSCCHACRRYGSKLQGLRSVFSEYGLIRLRVLVECRWLQHLAKLPQVTEVPPLEGTAQQLLEQLTAAFSVQDAQKVKDVSRLAVMRMRTAASFSFMTPAPV